MVFKIVELGELCEIKSSKRIYAKDYKESGIAFYRSKEIIQKYNNQEVTTELYISEEQFESIKSKYGVPKSGDILLTSVGTLGIPYLVDSADKFYFKDGNLTWFSNFESKINSRYLYHWFTSKMGKNEIDRITIGSTQKALTIVNLKKMKISLPPLEIQNKLVFILDSLNEKIKNNLSIIATLEAITSLLFKRFFIDFEFPNEQGLPYRSSGGGMTESELGEIPKGWEVGKIKDVCILKTDKVNLDKSTETFDYIGLEHMPQGSIALSNWESSEKVSGNKSVFHKGDFLFGKLRPYFKKVGIASINGVCSTDILVLQAKNLNQYAFLINHLTQDKFIEYTTSTATGTRMPRSGWNQISNYSIAIPLKEVLEDFNEKVLPMLVMIQKLVHEINNLQALRDTLLPKLLSGEIEIPDESVVEPS